MNPHCVYKNSGLPFSTASCSTLKCSLFIFQIMLHEPVPSVILFLTCGFFFDLCPPPRLPPCARPVQAPINAQMLAQRQRKSEPTSSAKTDASSAAAGSAANPDDARAGRLRTLAPSVVAPSGVPATMSNPRLPQANAQQFPFPPNYGVGPRPPPPFTSPFFPGSPHRPGSRLFVWIPDEPG